MPGAKMLPVIDLLRLALISCVVAIAGCGDSGERRMSRAEQHFEERHYAAAIVELKQALAAANHPVEILPRARWMLGMSYLRTGNMAAAAKELMHAKDLGWNPDEVFPDLAKALLRSGEYAQVVQLSTAGLDEQVAAKLQIYQALALLEQGDVWTADSYIGKAAEIRPTDIDVHLAQAQILDASGDIDGALAALERVLEAKPRRRDAWSQKAELLISQQKLPEALEALEVAIKLSPRSKRDRLNRAIINLHLQKLDKVALDANWLSVVSPKNPATHYLKGALNFHNGNYPVSIAALNVARPVAQQYPLILFYLAGAYLAEGNEAQALIQAEQQVNVNPDFAPGRILLASLYIKKSNVKEAQRILQPVLEADPTDSLTLNLMANAMMLDGKTDQALKILITLKQMAPESAVAHAELGAGLFYVGQFEAANQEFESALALDPTLKQAAIFRIQYLNNIQAFSAALAAAKDYARHYPESVHAHTLLGQNYMTNGQIDDAIVAFNKALSLAPGDPAANHALALIEQDRGNTEASRARYQAVLAKRPNYLPTLLHLVVLAAEPGNEDDMVAQLQHAIEAHPNALEPRLMLARYYLWENEPAKIPALFAMLSEAKQQSPEVLQLMAISQISDQQYGKALYNLLQLVELEPDTTLVHHLLATAAAGTGDMGQAKEELKLAEKLDKNFVPTLVSLARLAWADGNTKQFDHYLKRLNRLAPDTPEVLRLQAVAAERDGESARAIELSRQVLTAVSETKAMLELAGYLYVSGNSQEALQVVQDWLAKNPDDIEARMALANQMADMGQTEEATLQFREVVRQHPQNTEALLYISRQLRGEQPPALPETTHLAVTVKPGRAEILDTLALVESEVGNKQATLRHINRAVAASPDSPDLLYHQAMIEARMGNKNTAVEILKNVLGGDSTAFAEQERAEQLLASLQNFLANTH